MSRNYLIFILLILIGALTGCAQNEAWRIDGPCEVDGSNKKCNSSYTEIISEKCELSFIEFTERGNLFDREIATKILNRVHEYAKSDQGVAIIVYAHGWKHNASSKDENVQSFRKALEQISKSNSIGSRKIVGIYLGWRGLSLKFPLLRELTYWERKEVAQEIGKGGITEILLTLEKISESKPDNLFIAVGHSLGGGIMLSSMNEILMSRLIDSKCNNKPLKQFGDGIILLNPAIEANQIIQLKEIASEYGSNSSNETKLLHVISSKGDTANGWVFNLGQALGVGLTWNQEKLKRTYQSKPFKLNEWDLDITTVGNYKPFHTINLIDRDTSNDYANRTSDLGRWEFVNCCEREQECLLSKSRDQFFPCSSHDPISFVYTSEIFIEDHNDIFNNNVYSYMATIISESLCKKTKREHCFSQCIDDVGNFNFANCFRYHYGTFNKSERKK